MREGELLTSNSRLGRSMTGLVGGKIRTLIYLGLNRGAVRHWICIQFPQSLVETVGAELFNIVEMTGV